MTPSRRTVLAAALVTVAVLGPTIAWYLAGSSEVRRRSAGLEREALGAVGDDVEQVVERLERRLEALRDREGERPFYHYQNLFHDPRGAAQGLSVIRSPLAQGAPDPLVHAHFQIDEAGRVTLPAVSERYPELSIDDGFGLYCDFLADLQDAVEMTSDSTELRGVTGNRLEGTPVAGDAERVLVLARDSWQQIRLAEAVYANLTGQDGDPVAVNTGRDVDQVVVGIGPLHWRTLHLSGGPVLAAMRRVTTPSGTLVQGFAVSPQAIAEWVDEPGSEVVFVPAAEPAEQAVTLPVSETGWIVAADAEAPVATAREEGRRLGGQFQKVFAISVSAVVLAGCAVILIVFQADRLARQRARFAAAAAHELKTPLASLRLHSEMLAQGMGEPDRARLYAARVESEAARLGRVVANMLDLSRLERGAPLVEVSQGDLGRVVRDVVDRLRPSLEEAGVVVAIDLDPDLPAVSFDPDAVSQILHNLLDNAEAHTRGGDDRRVRVTVARHCPSVGVTVADNGPGIPRRARHGLFRPFVRGGAGETPSGLGLGLALARSLARAQGGELELAHSGDGAAFRLTLPGYSGVSAPR